MYILLVMYPVNQPKTVRTLVQKYLAQELPRISTRFDAQELMTVSWLDYFCLLISFSVF